MRKRFAFSLLPQLQIVISALATVWRMSYTPRYITAIELASLVKSHANLKVVDVRGAFPHFSHYNPETDGDEAGSDFVGGNIKGAINFPANERTERNVYDLVKKLEDSEPMTPSSLQDSRR